MSNTEQPITTGGKKWAVVALEPRTGTLLRKRCFDSKEKAQVVAEGARYAYDLHTQVIDEETGEVVSEFEV